MIRRLVLKNWRSHEESEFLFSEGTNVLIGRMGSGKSSVMDAISFALFGTFPALQSRKLKLEDCIMNKPNEKDFARVILELDLEGNIYQITREIRRGKGTANVELRKDGRLVEAGNTSRINEMITNLLGLDYNLFSKAVYSEQNQMDYFLQIPRGKRKQKIDELLGIDRFEEARRNLISIRNRIRDRVEDRVKELEGVNKEEIVKRLDKLELDVKGLESDLEKLVSEERQLGEKLLSVEREKRALEEARDRMDKLKKELERIRGELEAAGKRKREMEEKYSKFLSVDLKRKLSEIDEKRNSLDEERRETRKKLDGIVREIGELDGKMREIGLAVEKSEKLRRELKEIERTREELERASRDLDKEKARLDELRNEIARIRAKISEISDKLKSLEQAEGKCPVCERPLEEHMKSELIDHSTKRLDGLELMLREKLVELKKTETTVKELDEKTRRLGSLIGTIDEKRKELEELENKIRMRTDLERTKSDRERMLNEIKERLSSLDKEFDRLTEMRMKVERLIEIKESYDKLGTDIDALSKRSAQLEGEISKIRFDKSKYEDLQKLHLDLASSLSRVKMDIEGKRKLMNEKRELIRELKDRLRSLEEIEREVGVLKKVKDSVDLLISVLESGQVDLREEFVEAVNSALADVWPRLYPYGDYKSLRLSVDEKDYILQLQRRDGKWVSVEGIASGGERSTAALALRVAFSLVLAQNLSWIILDEPTHNLDRESVSSLARTLKEHLPSLVRQIFIITHDPDMEEAVSGTLYKLEREKEKDEPTRVILVSSGGA